MSEFSLSSNDPETDRFEFDEVFDLLHQQHQFDDFGEPWFYDDEPEKQ